MKRLMLILAILLSFSFAQAQSGCTDNLTEEECELYATAWKNLRNEQTLILEAVLDIEMSVGVSEDRNMVLDYGGIFERNQEGVISQFDLQGNILAHNGDVWNDSWETAYVSIVTFFEEGRFNYLIQTVGSDLGRIGGLEFSVETLSLESFFPIL